MSAIEERSFLKKIFKAYKFRASKKSIPWELSMDQFAAICSEPCAYCGAEPVHKEWLFGSNYNSTVRRFRSKEKFNGVDRINNDNGYVSNNVAPCCKTCNHMKARMSVSDFLGHIKVIMAHIGHLK